MDYRSCARRLRGLCEGEQGLSLQELINKEEVRSFRGAVREIEEVVSDNRRIGGRTHNFYKYPACFHPSFSNKVIKSFSKPGDTVLDPFVGGGTTAVEAHFLQRQMIGIDINPIAIFSTKFKTLKLSQSNIDELDEFFSDVISIRLSSLKRAIVREEFSKGIEQSFIDVIAEIKRMINTLNSKSSQIFAKGILLRQSKRLFDNPNRKISRFEFLREIFWDYEYLIDEQIAFNEECKNRSKELGLSKSKIKIFNGSVADRNVIKKVAKLNNKIDLVVTSPPYPQKHILYNKWQVNGRLENYLPHWIIDSEQIESENFYTMGGRSKSGEKLYYETIEESFKNVRSVVSNNGIVVQMVAFFDRARQLQPFLKAMSNAGFSEVRNITNHFDKRLWRDVPNRKWFNSANRRTGCKEVVLFHVPK